MSESLIRFLLCFALEESLQMRRRKEERDEIQGNTTWPLLSLQRIGTLTRFVAMRLEEHRRLGR